MQIIDVASILGLDYDISDHAFQLLQERPSCSENPSPSSYHQSSSLPLHTTTSTAAAIHFFRRSNKPRNSWVRTYEATNIVLATIKNLEPENATKIMGYLLMNLEENELVRLACSSN